MSAMRVSWGVLAVLCAALVGCGEPKVTDRSIQFIDLTTVRQLLADKEKSPNAVVLLDARPESDYRAGHIPTARNLRPADLNRTPGRDPSISAANMIVVYGDNRGSTVARAVTKELIRRRYKPVRMFDGGIDGWREAGYRLQTAE